MQLSCQRVPFSSAFSIAASAVPTRTPKDILRNVFLSVSGSGVELVGTDQEMAIRHAVTGVDTNSTGDALLPTLRMSQILRELQDERLDLVIDEKNITLKASSAKFRLSSEDPREYPPVPSFTDKSHFRIAAPVFRQMIRRTSFATDTESTRYALGGLLLEFAAAWPWRPPPARALVRRQFPARRQSCRPKQCRCWSGRWIRRRSMSTSPCMTATS
jgi:DNA polymerase-3 subunit beta